MCLHLLIIRISISVFSFVRYKVVNIAGVELVVIGNRIILFVYVCILCITEAPIPTPPPVQNPVYCPDRHFRGIDWPKTRQDTLAKKPCPNNPNGK